MALSSKPDKTVSSLLPDRTPLSIVLSIVRSWQVLERYLELELQKHDSSLTKFAIGNTLFRHGGELSPTELAAEIFRRKNTITSAIDRMEKGGFVQRVPSTYDRRSVNVVITDKGWGKTNQMGPVAQEISRDVLSCLDQQQINTLVTALRVLRESLLTKMERMNEDSAGLALLEGGDST
jgi:DNA-binding MarR family transcriptional regulator